MPRHVAYIEAHGPQTQERGARQRALIHAVAREHRPLPERPPHDDLMKTGTGLLDVLQRLFTR